MILISPHVAKHYVEQNKESQNSADATQINASHVVQHFKKSPPKILVEDLVLPENATRTDIDEAHQSYGYTEMRDEDGLVIVLYRNIVHATYNTGLAFRRLVFVLVVTIIHELSHYKIRLSNDSLDISPNKFKIYARSKAESGLWTEEKLFGGFVAVVDRDDLHSGHAPAVALRYQKQGSRVQMISDDWLSLFLRNSLKRKLLLWLDEKHSFVVDTNEPNNFKTVENKEIFERCAIGGQRFHNRAQIVLSRKVQPSESPKLDQDLQQAIDGQDPEKNEKD
jgi:hypothetical protein